MSVINLFSLLLLIVSDFAIAIPWNGPRPTGVDIFGADWSPAPTSPPSPLDLFRRAGQYPLWVCGFIAGNLGECGIGQDVPSFFLAFHANDVFSRSGHMLFGLDMRVV